MNGSRIGRVIVAVVLAGVASGCMPKLTMEDLQRMKPQRPVELDKLEGFVGDWSWEGETRVSGLDQVLSFTGSSQARLEGDGWFLVTEEIGDMEGFGKTHGKGLWAYDVRSKKFRTSWVDSAGSIATGVAWHDEAKDKWYLRVKTRGPLGTMIGKGSVKFIGGDAMDWTWSDYAAGGLVKVMDLKGRSTRRR